MAVAAGLLLFVWLAQAQHHLRPASAFLGGLDPSSAEFLSSRPKSSSSSYSAAVQHHRTFVNRNHRFPSTIATTIATTARSSRSSNTRRHYFNFPHEGNDHRPPVEELEKARAAFEALVARQQQQQHNPPPSTPQQPQQQQQPDSANNNNNNNNNEGQQPPTPTSSSSSSPLRPNSSSISSPTPDVNNSNSNNEEKTPTNDESGGDNVWLLTNAGRRLRELEIALLESLKASDGAVDELIHLWTAGEPSMSASNHDGDNSRASSILYMLDLQNGGSECSAGLVREERALREMAQQYPTWAEPRARLATLLFYQGGRHQECLEMAERAVSIKPWHFEALQIAAQLAQQQPQEPQQQQSSSTADIRDRARRLARRALPPLSDKRARRVWVDRAVAQAVRQLRDAELSLQQHNLRLAQRRQYVFRRDDIWQ